MDLLSDCENRWIVCSSSPHTAAAAVPTSHSASPLPSPTFLIYGCFGGCGFYDIVVIIIRTKSGIIMDPTQPPLGWCWRGEDNLANVPQPVTGAQRGGGMKLGDVALTCVTCHMQSYKRSICF